MSEYDDYDDIEENEYIQLPPQDIIDSNEEIALESWQKFSLTKEEEAFIYPTSYKMRQKFTHKEYTEKKMKMRYAKGKWKNTLSHYKDNVFFWEKLLENKKFQMTQLVANAQTISNDMFIEYYRVLYKEFIAKEITLDDAEGLLGRLRKKLPVEELKEHRYPQKHLFKHLQTKILYNDLNEVLETKENNNNKKLKI